MARMKNGMGLILLFLVSTVWAQDKAPRPQDVSTIDGVVTAYYEVVSGPPGQRRDWARDRTLYIPGVKFVAMSEKNGKPVAEVMSHDEYIHRVDGWLVENGFFEKEI